MRMKAFALVLLILLLFLTPYSNTQTIAAISFLFIWLHYAHQFNEKYTFTDSKFLIRSMPVRYYQIWSARFINELIFLIPVLIICFIALVIFESNLELVLLIFLALLLFALITLFIITNIRMIFYDNPRMAGYAYHVLIIFAAVMITNFYLVGPLVIFALLIYIGFMSHRQFSN